MPKVSTTGDPDTSNGNGESSELSALPAVDPELITYVGKGIPAEAIRHVANVALEIGDSTGVNWEQVEDWLSHNLPESMPDIVYDSGPGNKTARALIVHVRPTTDAGQGVREATKTVQKALDAIGANVDWSIIRATAFWRSGRKG